MNTAEFQDLRLPSKVNRPIPLVLRETKGSFFLPDGLVLGHRFIQVPSAKQIEALDRFQSQNIVRQSGGHHNVGTFLNRESGMLSAGQVAGIYHGTQLRLKKINQGDYGNDKIQRDKYIQWSMTDVDGTARPALTTRMPNFQTVNSNLSYQTLNKEDVILGIDGIDSLSCPLCNMNSNDHNIYPNIILIPMLGSGYVASVDEDGCIHVNDDFPAMGAYYLLAIAIDDIAPGEELILDYQQLPINIRQRVFILNKLIPKNASNTTPCIPDAIIKK